MTSSRIFSLEGKSLKLSTAADIEPYLQALKDNPDVEEVILVGNTLGVGACEALAEVLKTKKTLKHVNLADIYTGRLIDEILPALEALLPALLTLPKLHTINLSDNALGLRLQPPLVAFLKSHTPLEHLILNNNGLGPYAGIAVADALTELATKKKEENGPPLRTIVCGRNRLESGSMEAWAKAYAAHDQITSIRMVQNGIRPDGIAQLITHGLSHLSALETLDLQDNTFTAKGARALSKIVPKWTQIKELAMGDCLLSARGGIMLSEALQAGKNSGLEVLRLQYNDIDARSIKALAKAQDKLPKLRRIELNGNKFSEDDISLEALKEALDARREANGSPAEEGEHEDWGIDELDELDSEDDDDEDEEEEEEAKETEEKESILKEADEAESENVAQDKSKTVNDLADLLDKTEIK
ncbi:hypothetical protein FKW77_009866 [Venturia effusa]|uniref:Ran GTPase-activating protein 1 n=1 Tax=Venturia effusa TaxID=50376 RepID=A0A517LBT5_9PEZI|nr:hypothetical protein FKW77_009866 [Venturia effusa]